TIPFFRSFEVAMTQSLVSIISEFRCAQGAITYPILVATIGPASVYLASCASAKR
ncbi:MAG: hypothetical protein RLY88_506, partial [Actinomycetota bacterium]